ncbi:hypothetical protein TNCV_3509841 [Trichonephila clavipes]|nr:hypothetical protein TNCV_3509841 [Trichonephila clavipes]
MTIHRPLMSESYAPTNRYATCHLRQHTIEPDYGGVWLDQGRLDCGVLPTTKSLGNYWEGHPSEPPGVGGAFEKLFCLPLRPAVPDGGLNLAWLTCRFRRLITVQNL